MLGYVANTDHNWFDYLASQGPWDEVNFWNPSDFYLFRGKPNSPFFFRLKSPRNALGGFGFVARADRLPEWLAWECFGSGNGSATLDEMQGRIRRLRDSSKIEDRGELQQIGCIILSFPVFFPPGRWVAQPSDWKPQNLRYTGYDLTTGEGLRIWNECRERAEGMNSLAPTLLHDVDDDPESARWGDPTLVRPRLGQGAFRLAVTDAYDRACAITQEHSLPALEAAHIKPFAQGGAHDVSNGLLLRSDFHRLFDKGYLTVTPEHRLEVSRHLRDHFSNGRSYYPLHGSTIVLPKHVIDRPDAAALAWHNEHVYRG